MSDYSWPLILVGSGFIWSCSIRFAKNANARSFYFTPCCVGLMHSSLPLREIIPIDLLGFKISCSHWSHLILPQYSRCNIRALEEEQPQLIVWALIQLSWHDCFSWDMAKLTSSMITGYAYMINLPQQQCPQTVYTAPGGRAGSATSMGCHTQTNWLWLLAVLIHLPQILHEQAVASSLRGSLCWAVQCTWGHCCKIWSICHVPLATVLSAWSEEWQG